MADLTVPLGAWNSIHVAGRPGPGPTSIMAHHGGTVPPWHRHTTLAWRVPPPSPSRRGSRHVAEPRQQPWSRGTEMASEVPEWPLVGWLVGSGLNLSCQRQCRPAGCPTQAGNCRIGIMIAASGRCAGAPDQGHGAGRGPCATAHPLLTANPCQYCYGCTKQERLRLGTRYRPQEAQSASVQI